jgi:hypothetical protein
MMEAARTSETSVDIQLRTQQYIPEDSELYTDNLHFMTHSKSSATDELLAMTVFCIREVSPNFGSRALNRKKWDAGSRVHSNITAVALKPQ